MAGEQPTFLNLSPEESLTNVHERLRLIPERRIVLIVPQQTQLRSLISWRLLRGYARELNKDVLVISADRQIRSVAKEAGFRVAESLAVPPSSRKRGSNPGRGATGTGAAHGNRGARGIARFRQSESQQSTSSRRATTGSDLRERSSPLQPPPEEQEANELHISNLGEDDEAESTGWSVSPSFGGQYDAASRYEPPIDFRIATNLPLRPVEPTPEVEDEDEDVLPYGYEQSQRIFQAARQQEEDKASSSAGKDTGVSPGSDSTIAPRDRMIPPVSGEQAAQENIPPGRRQSSPLSSTLSPSARALEDPFDVVDDYQPSPLSEQRGAAPVFPFDDEEDIEDVSQYPTTDIPAGGVIEDMGDSDMPELPPPPTWEEAEEEQEVEPEQEQEEVDELPPAYYPPRRSGQLSPMGTAAANAAHEEDAIEDQSTRIIPPALSLPDALAGQPASPTTAEEVAARAAVPPTPTRNREPKPVELRPGGASTRQVPGRRRFSASPSARGGRPAPRSRKPVIATRRKQNRLSSVLIAIAVLLIVGLILFVFPSATVTVTLAAKAYSWPVVVSGATSQNLARHTVPVYKLTFTASVTQTGQASGANTPVGTASAQGLVLFTNNGTKPVTIPSGVVVSTTNNVSFVTTAQGVVTGNGGINYIPVQAQTPGTSGNVAANTITVIPQSSISQIAQASTNLASTDVKLSVTNPSPTSGGGVGSATTVTKNDVSNLQKQASSQLYRELKNWLTQEQARGNVPASQVQESQLAIYETVTATPAAGQVASHGTFNETVKLSIPVAFVHSSDLQAQAVAQYQQLSNASTLPKGTTRPPKGYEPAEGQPVQLNPASCPSSGKSSTANASTLCFTATAPVALPITAQQVQNLVGGKQVKVVRAQLANSKTGLPGIKAVSVNVSPGFWPWMPFWTQRISVHFITSTSASSR